MKTETYTDPTHISPFFRESANVLIQIFTSLSTCDEINQLIKDVKGLLPHAKILGATAGAKIFAGRLTYDSTLLVVTAFSSSSVQTGIVHTVNNLSDDAADLTLRLQDTSPLPPKVAIIFSEGLHLDGEVLLRGVADVQPTMIIAGGIASDHHLFEKTMVFTQEGCTSEGFVMAMLFGEKLTVYNHFSFNWIGLGRTFTVTKAIGNRVWELDNTPILDIYKRYLGDQVAVQLPDIVGLEFPMIITNKEMPIARAVMVKHDDGSLGFAGSMHEGTTVRFGFGDSEGIITDANNNNDYFLDKPVETLFVYSCVARLSLVGKDIEQETIRLQRFAPTSGFYTYGEFYHAPCEKCNRFLNQTMTILGLSEGEERPKVYETIPSNRPRASLLSGAMSHFVREITTDMENAIEAEKRSKEIMLHQSRQATIGETIEIIAHQWRQPLNIIALALQDLYIKGELGTLTQETLISHYQKANTALQYLSQTIDDFRDFMRPDNEIEIFSVHSLMSEIKTLTSGLVKKHHIHFNDQTNPEHIMYNRKNALLQTLLILTYNAIDAIVGSDTKNGQIIITTAQQKNKIVWRICDNGGGVPKEHKENIFEPYFTTKGKNHGTGMGLYIASSLVKHYLEGEISLKNNKDGACFTLKLIQKLDPKHDTPTL
ncbi:MAG: FIST C-terminal domain-containing protein [Campylobacterales bacterium]|nr:FIST C-terminal domain-containing protein [Campylobacterales bacterium]